MFNENDLPSQSPTQPYGGAFSNREKPGLRHVASAVPRYFKRSKKGDHRYPRLNARDVGGRLARGGEVGEEHNCRFSGGGCKRGADQHLITILLRTAALTVVVCHALV